MGLFDKLKKKNKVEKKPAEKKSVVKDVKEEKKETAVTPDGRLVTTTKKDTKKEKKTKTKKEDTGDAYRILIKPLISEKGSWLGAYNQYLFEVSTRANKNEVKKAIKKVYGVNPVKVNIMNVSGKEIRYGRTQGRTKNWKKAIITLATGQKIDIQEGI